MLIQHSNRWRDLLWWQTTTKWHSGGRSWTSFDEIVDFHYPLPNHARSRHDAFDNSWQLWHETRERPARHFSDTVSRHVVLHHRDQDPEIRGATSGQIRREADSLTTLQYLFGKTKVESSAQIWLSIRNDAPRRLWWSRAEDLSCTEQAGACGSSVKLFERHERRCVCCGVCVKDMRRPGKRQRYFGHDESGTYAIETPRVIINADECNSQWYCSDWWTHAKQNHHHGRDVKQTSIAQTLSDKLFLILSVLDHSDFTDVISKKERGRRHKRNSTKPSVSTWSALMVYKFEVYVSLARALSYLCTCIVVRFSFMIMQVLPFRFKSTLAHHFRVTGVISQFLGWDASASGFLDKHNNRWQQTRTDWCATVFWYLGRILFFSGENVTLISDIILMISSYSRHLQICLRSDELSGPCSLCQWSSMLPSVLTTRRSVSSASWLQIRSDTQRVGVRSLAHLCLGSLERRGTSMRSRRSRRRLEMTCQTRILRRIYQREVDKRVPLMNVSLSCGIGCSRESIMLKKEACFYLDDWVIDAYEELELVPVRWTAAKKEGGVALNRFTKRAQFRCEPRLTRKCWT